LRTPLNPIIGFTELLMDAPNLTEEQRSWLEIIHQRGNDLLGLIGTVLDLCKVEAQKIELVPREIPLRATLSELVRCFTPIANKKGLSLTWTVSPEIPDSCWIDSLRFRQIILNLLNNAIKFTPSGSIDLRVEPYAVPAAEEPIGPDEGYMLIAIRDTGIGIPLDRQKAIFESFTQADPDHAVDYGGGTGLGLTIVKSLVELMRGRIWVESVPGQGSTFSFTLCVGRSPAGISSPDPIPESQLRLPEKPVHALVVDDDPGSIRITESILKRNGYRVSSACNGRLALEMISEHCFDIVLLDVQMPVMDGIATIREIRAGDAESGRHTPVIALTAFALSGDRERMLEAGMDDYVTKPVYPEQLMRAIERLSCRA
jgi:CheY-like chemotaxis protein